jgi:hydroxylamine reductase (hybrid-cluster protein)
MTETLNKIVVDCSTGEQSIVSLTAEEIAQRELDAQAYAEAEAERVAAEETLAALKASAKAKLIAGEPLTAEEADTLVI